MRTADFFAFARERHAIYLRRKMGDPRPWTEDPILSTYRFTNVFRELDRTTVWFRENVRDRLAEMSSEQQILGTILFRTLNRVESGEVIFNQGHLFLDRPPGWMYVTDHPLNPGSTKDIEDALRSAYPNGPWVTGAYIVKTPDGMDKLRGALWIVEEARKRLPATVASAGFGTTLQGLWTSLLAYPYYGGGGFMAYEVVTDLRHLPVAENAVDIMTWANAGPGAKRGINRILGRDKDHPLSQEKACQVMRELLFYAGEPDHWPADWPRWEMREIEHTLCEWDKYMRVINGEGRPRGVYR